MPVSKAWDVAYKRDRAAGMPRYVNAEPTRDRLAELAAAHVPLRALARASGLSVTGVKAILDGSHEHVQRGTARRVASVSMSRIFSGQATGHVPRVGAVRRVQGLLAMGWSHHDLRAAGVPSTPGLLATTGHLVTVQRWRQVRDVYDRLAMTRGPSPQTRGWAKALGYAPPLAWDDDAIDDPTATPAGLPGRGGGGNVIDLVAIRRTIDSCAARPPLNALERTEVVRAMAACGGSDAQIGQRLGVADRTVLRMRQRENIPAGRPRAGRDLGDLDWADANAATRRTGPQSAARGGARSAPPASARAVGR